MYSYKYGGKQGVVSQLDIADDLIVVRTKHEKALPDAVTSPKAKQILSQLSPVLQILDAGVSVLQCQQGKRKVLQLRDEARRVLKQEKDIRFAGKALRGVDGSDPVIYTENFFVKFHEGVSRGDCDDILKRYQLTVKRKVDYTNNGFFIYAAEGTGLDTFRLADELLNEEKVEFCHPELIRKRNHRAIAPQQWHLHEAEISGKFINAHINIKEAWDLTMGENTTIAIIDDGVDIDHDEFATAGKVVHPRDAVRETDDPRPKDRFYAENHGTACAGVACAAGQHQASGVAPDAKLMPIRLVAGLGSQAEADAFAWAADKGADVISCSWGPEDGDWSNPNDALHHQQTLLPDNTRLAIDYAVRKGRNGKGCVITWAAGNGNESVDNDGYASYEKVIAVAASNDQNKRSIYSDFGEAVWVCFPSNDFGYSVFNHPRPNTEGIWTTDREGRKGYNPGVLNPLANNPPGDDHGNYTESFGGTSSACPGVAGVAALILSVNPGLYWNEVKGILRRTAEKIDTVNGGYDTEGHSPFYGYGRVDATKAVQLAKSQLSRDEQLLKFSVSVQGNIEQSGAEKLYAIDLTGETTIRLTGKGDIDIDLYVKKGEAATIHDYDDRAYTPKSSEILHVKPSSPGRYYILVRSYEGQGEFKLTVEID